MFWREFLWEAARDTCPVEGFCPTLDETLPNATFLWDGGGEGAIGDIARFMLSRDEDGTRWLRFGAEGERSIQPTRAEPMKLKNAFRSSVTSAEASARSCGTRTWHHSLGRPAS